MPSSAAPPPPPRDETDEDTEYDEDEKKTTPPTTAATAAMEESRRLFQRLWTDEDEIVILEGFHEFTSQRGTTHHAHQHDTGPFYDQIKSRLQLHFTKSQLVEKLRRLKKKYRNAVARMESSRKDHFAFKSPHDQTTFQISNKIWSNTVSRSSAADHGDEDDVDSGSGYRGRHGNSERSRNSGRRKRKRPAVMAVEAAVPETVLSLPVEVKASPAGEGSSATVNVVEETVRCCVAPLFKELLHSAISGGGPPLVEPLSSVGHSRRPTGSVAMEEKWRKQHILELEVYSKRLELVQEQVKATLAKLRSERR